MTVEVIVQPATREDAQRIIRGLMQLAEQQASTRNTARGAKEKATR